MVKGRRECCPPLYYFLMQAISHEPRHNWAGNLTYHAAGWHAPTTPEAVSELVSRAAVVKVLGTRHSFNEVADTTGEMISLERLQDIAPPCHRTQTVTIGAGVRYADLGPVLHEHGYALANLASLPHISVAGACATATHGSGLHNTNLSTAVCALELVTGNGETVRLSREADGDRFCGAVVNLGALGVVTRLTLKLLPAFTVRQVVYEHLPFAYVEEQFAEALSSAYSVSLFTDWRGETVRQVWQKHRSENGDEQPFPEHWQGATLAKTPLHPLPDMPAHNCTLQQGIPGPWHERLPHFRREFTPSHGEELQSEYFVPLPNAPQAVREMRRLGERLAPQLLVSEVRAVAADDLWLSPCYKQACAGFHFTWKRDWPGVRELLPLIEERLVPLGARPHWGKLFTVPAEWVRSRYERLPDFDALRREFDPDAKFANAFLNSVLPRTV